MAICPWFYVVQPCWVFATSACIIYLGRRVDRSWIRHNSSTGRNSRDGAARSRTESENSGSPPLHSSRKGTKLLCRLFQLLWAMVWRPSEQPDQTQCTPMWDRCVRRRCSHILSALQPSYVPRRRKVDEGEARPRI